MRTIRQDGAPFPWKLGETPQTEFPAGFFLQPAEVVARQLLGARLVSLVRGRRTAGVIVETEAYLGGDDPASHAATRRGLTKRNRAMFGPPKHAYVYRIYGMHWCVNVVTGPVGQAQAVLLRGLDPIDGDDEMSRRRGGKHPLAAGPGRLCESLGVTDALYGHDLSREPLELLPGWSVADAQIGVSGRIGVKAAADWPLRFFMRGNRGVSGAPSGLPRARRAASVI